MRSTRVRTDGQLAVVEELRREVLGEKSLMARGASPRVHHTGLEPLDRKSRLWLAWDGDHPVGTIRATFGADVDLCRHFPAWALRPFIEAAGRERLVVYSQFLVRRAYRSRLAAPLLMLEAARSTFERGADLGFVRCAPDAVSHFETLGFRHYRATTCDRARDANVPMVVLFSDRDHLARVGSPLRDRVPDSIPARPETMLVRLVDGWPGPANQASAAPIGSRCTATWVRRPSNSVALMPTSSDGIRPSPAPGRAPW